MEHFLEASKRNNICYNTDKCIFLTRRAPPCLWIRHRGWYHSPRSRSSTTLTWASCSTRLKVLNRCLGLFSYYSQWIPKFSDRMRPIAGCKSFPLTQQATGTFESLMKTIENIVVTAVDESILFEVETDASEVAVAAKLNQNGRPVAFFSRTLQGSELKNASIEKEPQAIIETVRHWRHFLTGRHFILRTDQKSVSYMFDKHHRGKITNEKFLGGRLELSCYSLDLIYHPGWDNIPPDTLSRVMDATATADSLHKLHNSLCHPGVTRLSHFVQTKTLPYSLEEIKNMTSQCPVCCECKPQYHRPEKVPLIKATQLFEKINVDFKGLLPTNNGDWPSTSSWWLMSTPGFRLFFLFLTCQQPRLLSALLTFSRFWECQPMSILIAGPPSWAKGYASF